MLNSRLSLSTLLTARITGFSVVRSRWAAMVSDGVIPSATSVISMITSASFIAISACSCTRERISPSGADSSPPVSNRMKRRPSQSVSAISLSRVVPATSDTMACLQPTMRLKSDDLPTLGRPTIAMMGKGIVIAALINNSLSRKERVRVRASLPSAQQKLHHRLLRVQAVVRLGIGY